MVDTILRAAITGDIAATADVTVNAKGGSLTATLKKPLRDPLGKVSDQLSGAAVRFATGEAVVLLAELHHELMVRKTGHNRFEIELDDHSAEEVDVVTAAFLNLKKQQLEKGLLRLSETMTAKDWGEKMDRELAEARELLSGKQK